MIIAVVAGAVAAGTGCGSSTSLSRVAYIAAANRACRANMADPVRGGVDAATVMARVEAQNERLVRDVRALRGPAQLTSRVRRALDVMAQSFPLGKQIAALVRDAERGAVSPERAAQGTTAPMNQADALIRRAANALVALGLTDCKQS